jgi:hypothetical protein
MVSRIYMSTGHAELVYVNAWKSVEAPAGHDVQLLREGE